MKTSKTTKSKTTKTTSVPPADVPVRAATATAVAAKAPAKQMTAPRREITTDLIAQRAYIIWEQQGRPQGKDLQNWLLAENQLKQEIQSFTA